MPRTDLNAQTVGGGGLVPVYTPANTDGHAIRTNGRRVLHIRNGSAAAVTVTVPTPGDVDGNAIADRAVVVPSAGEAFIAPSAPVYRQTDGTVHVNYSAVASVTVALLEV